MKEVPKASINFCQILKTHIGKTFYSHAYGPIKVESIASNQERPLLFRCVESNSLIKYTSDGKFHHCGHVDLYPSEELMEEYPMKPILAWDKWLDQNAQKASIKFVIQNEGFVPKSGQIVVTIPIESTSSDYFQLMTKIQSCLEKKFGFQFIDDLNHDFNYHNLCSTDSNNCCNDDISKTNNIKTTTII